MADTLTLHLRSNDDGAEEEGAVRVQFKPRAADHASSHARNNCCRDLLEQAIKRQSVFREKRLNAVEILWPGAFNLNRRNHVSSTGMIVAIVMSSVADGGIRISPKIARSKRLRAPRRP